MNTKTLCRVAVALMYAGIVPAVAQEPTQSMPAVHAEAIRYVVDCQNRRLPSQREVGEWTGQRNFSQVYDTRQRLMAEIGRGCQGSGIEQIQVVSRTDIAVRDLQLVAIADRRKR